MHVVLGYLYSLRYNSLLKCALQPKKIFKKHQETYSGGSRSFKIIDVDTTEKLVTSVCYDKQHGSAYLQQFPR